MVSTVRVLVTFTKFEELQQENVDEFESAPSSPTGDQKTLEEEENSSSSSSSSSWFQWIKAPSRSNSSSLESSSRVFDEQDLFAIPSDYKWFTEEEKAKQRKARKAKMDGSN